MMQFNKNEERAKRRNRRDNMRKDKAKRRGEEVRYYSGKLYLVNEDMVSVDELARNYLAAKEVLA